MKGKGKKVVAMLISLSAALYLGGNATMCSGKSGFVYASDIADGLGIWANEKPIEATVTFMVMILAYGVFRAIKIK